MNTKKVTSRPDPPIPEPRSLRACHHFSEKVREILASKRITVGQIEAELELGANTLGRWGQGKIVRLDEAFLIARRLGVSLDLLADDDRGIEIRQTIEPAPAPSGPASGGSRAVAVRRIRPKAGEKPSSGKKPGR